MIHERYLPPAAARSHERGEAFCFEARAAPVACERGRALPGDRPHLDRRCVAVAQDEREVELTFARRDGRTARVTADLAIGADGIHSVVQQAIAPEPHLRFSGLCAFRCLVPAYDAPEMALRPVQTLWLGPGRHLVHDPISGGRLVNVVAFVPAGDWRTESWTADGDVADLRAEFASWGDPLRRLLASATTTKRCAVDRAPRGA